MHLLFLNRIFWCLTKHYSLKSDLRRFAYIWANLLKHQNKHNMFMLCCAYPISSQSFAQGSWMLLETINIFTNEITVVYLTACRGKTNKLTVACGYLSSGSGTFLAIYTLRKNEKHVPCNMALRTLKTCKYHNLISHLCVQQKV